MSKYIQTGKVFHITSDLGRLDHLPPQNYVLKYDEVTGFFLEVAEPFDLPQKMYGGVGERAERIINTYQDRPKSTGVLLAGEKGSGKSLLGKVVSVLAAETLSMPTVLITAPYHGPAFQSFIQSISQDCVVLFDEFEKVYEDKAAANSLLTLFDGVISTKKLFILTTNERYAVSSYLQNRPGRIYYNIDYKGVSEEFIREYCADRLDDQTQTENIVLLSSMFYEFNFDMLSALVEEMNRYKETAEEAMEMLNVRNDEVRQEHFEARLYKDNKLVATDSLHTNPFQAMRIRFDMDPAGDTGKYESVILRPHLLKKMSKSKGEFVYELENGDRVVLVRNAVTSKVTELTELFAAAVAA